MPLPTKDFPSTADLARVKAEDDFYLLYNADPEDPKTDRAAFRLAQFFENDQKKAKILDIALHLAPIAVDVGTDFLFGEPFRVTVDQEKAEELQKKVDAILERARMQRKAKESATLFQAIGHTHFKVYAEVGEAEEGKGQKRLACIEEVPYNYWFPLWTGVPLGEDSEDVCIVVYMNQTDADGATKKYVYVENYYLPAGGKTFVCAKSLWQDKNGQIGDQVALSTLGITPASGAKPDEKRPMTMVEDTLLAELPLASLHARKTVKERYGQSVLKKALPILHEINDRLSQLSIQFLKHLNAKLQIPDGTVTRDEKGNVQAVNMEVLIARAGEPEAKYITNDNPLIEQAFVHLEKLIRKFAKLTMTPDLFLTEDDKGGVEKAESLKTRMLPLLKKIRNYQASYDDALKQLIRLALAVEGVKDVAAIPLKITYDLGLPKDWQADATTWGDALTMHLASKETAVARFQGIDGKELDAELKRIQDDEDAAMQSALDLQNAKNDPQGDGSGGSNDE